MRWLVGLLVAVALVAVPSALADDKNPTSAEIQAEIWCKDCNTTLDNTNSGITREMVRFIDSGIAAGKTKSQIKDEVVDKYGWRATALPSKTEGDRPTLADLEDEVMCPLCSTTLDQSSSPAARQIEAFITSRIEAGDSKQEIKDQLVVEYGAQILAAPPKKGFDLLAWLLPLVGLLGGALVLGGLAWRWTRIRDVALAGSALDPATERRVDEELARYDES